MNFDIPCEIFLKLAKVLNYIEPDTPLEVKNKINFVRLERKNGHYYAISTNKQIASIYYLGVTDSPDGAVNVRFYDGLLQQCETEALMGSNLHITTVPEMLMGTVSTTLGFTGEGNLCDFSDTPVADWPKWIWDQEPVRTNGRLFFDTDIIGSLIESSPTGKVYFQEFVDVEQPVCVRDYTDASWVGLFVGSPSVTSRDVPEGHILPSWWGR